MKVPSCTWIAAALLALGGCTASRAVEDWRAGWALEHKGDPNGALKRYNQAMDRMGTYPGLSLNRIRLLATFPERRQEAQEALEKLLKSHGGDLRVASFATQWALWQGDVALARTRLSAAAQKPDEEQEAIDAWHQAELGVLVAERKWREAWAMGRTLPPGTPRERLLLATVAWNAGDAAHAKELLEGSQECREKWVLGAMLQAQLGEWAGVRATLGRLEGDAVTPAIQALRAEAALHADPPDLANALRDAAEAARRDPADPLVTEVWAVAQLVGQQPQLARDLLAALTVRGTGWSAWYNLGLASLKLGDLPGAQQAFSIAAQRCPTCPAAVRNRDVLAAIAK